MGRYRRIDDSTFEVDPRREEFIWRPKKPADFSHCQQYLAK